MDIISILLIFIFFIIANIILDVKLENHDIKMRQFIIKQIVNHQADIKQQNTVENFEFKQLKEDLENNISFTLFEEYNKNKRVPTYDMSSLTEPSAFNEVLDYSEVFETQNVPKWELI